MKVSIIKKMMMGALTVSLVMAPVMSVAATTTTGSTESVVEKEVSSTTSEEVTTVAEIPSTSSVAGTKSSVTGVYDKKVQGTTFCLYLNENTKED